jgi:hypothetical protein
MGEDSGTERVLPKVAEIPSTHPVVTGVGVTGVGVQIVSRRDTGKRAQSM